MLSTMKLSIPAYYCNILFTKNEKNYKNINISCKNCHNHNKKRLAKNILLMIKYSKRSITNMRNIPIKRKIITPHLTEMQKIILPHSKIILSSLAIITLCFLNVLLCPVPNTSALTYSSNVDVGFTFNPTVSINLSGDLLINNLAPSSSADSNTVNVTVTTNNANGYTLLATAGTSSTDTNLTNTTNSSYKFTSISTTSNLSSLTTNNTWGFSYSTNNGSTWSNYTGLPKDNDDEGATGKQLAKTTSQSQNLPIQVKIGAKAGPEQAAGTYTNVINFYAVANVSSGRNYTINYIDPSGNAEDMPAQQTGTTSNNKITIANNEPYDNTEGRIFYMWCDSYDGYSGYMEYCSGEDYYPGDTITVADGTGDIVINLYTTWYSPVMYYSLNVSNNSEGDVYVDGYQISPEDSYSDDSIMEQTTISISIQTPKLCEGTFKWTANIDPPYDGPYSGEGSGSFSFVLEDSTDVTISGQCEIDDQQL